VDPQNDLRVWVLGNSAYYSEDGGRNFRDDRVVIREVHGDFHALWINPADPRHMVLGSDGGVHLSFEAGRTWDLLNNLPLGQFYEIGYDLDQPYRVYGGLQDNGSWGGPVRTLDEHGIANEDWRRVGGGDGFYARVDPAEPSTVYLESQGGNLQRLDLRSMERKNIRPEPEEVTLSVGERRLSSTVLVEEDPRIRVSPDGRRAHLEALLRLGRLLTALDQGRESLAALKAQLDNLRQRLGKLEGAPTRAVADADSLWDKLEKLERAFAARAPRAFGPSPPCLFTREWSACIDLSAPTPRRPAPARARKSRLSSRR
jgi:hypothetical protein